MFGYVRGSLSFVLPGAMHLVSGRMAPDMAAVVPVLFPKILQLGSRPGNLAALLVNFSAMSATIPPSLVFIAVGSHVSVTTLFTGGLLAAVVLVIVSWYRLRHMDTGERDVRRLVRCHAHSSSRAGRGGLVNRLVPDLLSDPEARLPPAFISAGERHPMTRTQRWPLDRPS